VKSFSDTGWKTVGTGFSRAQNSSASLLHLDLLDHSAIEKALDDVIPNVVVHCAANRFPDSCTANPRAAAALNIEATRHLAKQCNQRGIILIYISTDYVFSGKRGEAPYKPSDPTNPTNFYGKTKANGEQAVLEETGVIRVGHSNKPLGIVLRVPLLYGHCEENDPSKSAVHVLLDTIWKAQSLKEGDAKLKVDDYALRYPTATEDVGRVCVDIVELYTKDEDGTQDLPRILHFSSETCYTKYGMVKLFAEDILGLPIDNIEAWDPTQDEEASGGSGGTVRPYDSHLDTQVLKDIGISVATRDFIGWW
jgi:S-adenosylmethionine synthetase